ncbi:cyanoexosortase A system-associated protein [Sphaerothrix gracilis]|uniref:cyanoexosortase A system-associated protein n=1 Tax=Sphaerothrix gracilis TaxID=3151835 RepID=UPI0031FCBE44
MLESKQTRQYWRSLRSILLCLTCLSIFGVLGKLLLASEASVSERIKPQPLTFPDRIALANFRFLASQPIAAPANPEAQNRFLINGQIYRYQQNSRFLTAEMYYMVDTSGNVAGFLEQNTAIPIESVRPALKTEKYQAAVGYYLLFPYQEKRYLASCINPKGESTVTLPQFRDNRYRYDILSPRLLKWLLTSENIRDFRCLWVLMSTSSAQKDPGEDYQVLEQAWFDWQAQWQPQFSRFD